MTSRSIIRWCALLPALAVAACASQRPAPVADRSGRTPATAAPGAAPAVVRSAKDGIYVAQRGDTLQNVALAFGVDQKDGASTSGTTAPLPPAALPPTGPSPAVPPVVAAPPTAPPEPSRAPSSSLPWLWPTSGKVIETFDDPRNKGIDIAGNEGAPVQAAADGEVVYVGSAVRGYGNLVIVRHSDDFITAYAHNRKVLVAEKQSVKRGQPIAELGRSDADRPKLHFEIRHQGKPVDPLKYLPARSQ